MERMLAAFEPVHHDEGFAAVYSGGGDGLISTKEQMSHEYCHEAR
jgi:hypothetical protein